MALLLATGAIVGLAGLSAAEAEQEQRKERAVRRMLLDPRMRRDVAMLQALEDSMPVKLLVIHVESTELATKLAGTTLRLKVKYGRGDWALKESSRATKATRAAPGEPVTAQFQTTCVFPWKREFEQVLKLSLEKEDSLFENKLSETRFKLPFQGTPQEMQREVTFLQGRSVLGHVHVRTELISVPRGALCGRMPLAVRRHRSQSCTGARGTRQERGSGRQTQTAEGSAAIRPISTSRGKVVQGRVVPGAGHGAVVQGLPVGQGCQQVVQGKPVSHSADCSSPRTVVEACLTPRTVIDDMSPRFMKP